MARKKTSYHLDFDRDADNAFDLEHAAVRAVLDTVSAATTRSGEMIGTLFQVRGRDGGNAYYVVERERPLTISHIDITDEGMYNQQIRDLNLDGVRCAVRGEPLLGMLYGPNARDDYEHRRNERQNQDEHLAYISRQAEEREAYELEGRNNARSRRRAHRHGGAFASAVEAFGADMAAASDAIVRMNNIMSDTPTVSGGVLTVDEAPSPPVPTVTRYQVVNEDGVLMHNRDYVRRSAAIARIETINANTGQSTWLRTIEVPDPNHVAAPFAYGLGRIRQGHVANDVPVGPGCIMQSTDGDQYFVPEGGFVPTPCSEVVATNIELRPNLSMRMNLRMNDRSRSMDPRTGLPLAGWGRVGMYDGPRLDGRLTPAPDPEPDEVPGVIVRNTQENGDGSIYFVPSGEPVPDTCSLLLDNLVLDYTDLGNVLLREDPSYPVPVGMGPITFGTLHYPADGGIIRLTGSGDVTSLDVMPTAEERSEEYTAASFPSCDCPQCRRGRARVAARADQAALDAVESLEMVEHAEQAQERQRVRVAYSIPLNEDSFNSLSGHHDHYLLLSDIDGNTLGVYDTLVAAESAGMQYLQSGAVSHASIQGSAARR